MVKQINLSNYYLRKSEIDRLFGITNSNSDSDTIEALKDIIDGKSNTGLEIKKTISSGDLNNETEIGFYKLTNLSTLGHSPTSTENYGIMEIVEYATNGTRVQIIYTLKENEVSKIYHRKRWQNGTYENNWAQVATINDIPTGSSTATDIQMNGTQSAGTSSQFAKANHVHPTDTSRAPATHVTNDKGTSTTFGHVKVSDNISISAGNASQSVAASSKALTDVYNIANSFIINAGYVDDDFIMCFGDSRNLSITASKECIQADETVTLVGFSDTATSLDFYEGDTKIGTSNVIDDCAAFTYTGDGSGMLNFSVKYGSSQSETFEIIDGIFYDDGVTSPKPVNWYKATNTLEVSIDNTGTLLSCTEATNYYANSTSSINRFLDSDFCIEFDVVEFTGSFGVRLRTTSNTDIALESKVNNGSHVKITFKNNELTYTIDDGTPQTVSQSITGNVGVSIRLGTGTNSIKYKNFVVYPI